jgi:hypothetical protein
MKITLHQLNESYPALVKLAQTEFPKERHKLAYKLSRILKSAKVELETAQESLNDLMRACGFEPGQQDVDPAKLAEFQKQMKVFMRETSVDVWGDPIRLEELGEVAISAFDLSLLDWLIIEEEEETPKAQSAGV